MEVIYRYKHPILKISVEQINSETYRCHVVYRPAYDKDAERHILSISFEYNFTVGLDFDYDPQFQRLMVLYLQDTVLPWFKSVLQIHLEMDTIPKIVKHIRETLGDVSIETKRSATDAPDLVPQEVRDGTVDVFIDFYIVQRGISNIQPYSVEGKVSVGIEVLWGRKFESANEYYNALSKVMSDLMSGIEMGILTSFGEFNQQPHIIEAPKAVRGEFESKNRRVRLYIPDLTGSAPSIQYRVHYLIPDKGLFLTDEGYFSFDVPNKLIEPFLKGLRENESDVKEIIGLVLFYYSFATRKSEGSDEAISSLFRIKDLLEKNEKLEGVQNE